MAKYQQFSKYYVHDVYAPRKQKYTRGNHIPFMNTDQSKETMTRATLRSIFLIDRSEGNKRKYPKQSNYCVSLLRKSRLEYFGNCNEKHSGKPRNRKTIKPFLSDKIKSTQKITLIEKDDIIIGDDNTAEVFLF